MLLLTLMPSGTSATYTHENLTLTVIINNEDVSSHNVKENPLVLDLSQPIEVELMMSNTGDTVHLTDMSVPFSTIQTILWVWDWEVRVYTHHVDVDGDDQDGDGQEGFDISADSSASDSFEITPEDVAEYQDELSGQRVRIDVIFNFEDIDDYTITVYVNFV